MRRGRARLVLGVELAADEPRMAFQLDDLHEFAVWGDSGDAQPLLLDGRNVLRIDLVTMAGELLGLLDAIRGAGDRAFAQGAGIFAEAHGAAEGVDADEIAELE